MTLTLLMLMTTAAVDAYSGKVMLVSMDGFRADYITSVTGLGNFTRLSNMGCHVKNLIPPFATVTFPSHYTLVTGLHEESHGIVSNSMYDPLLNATFTKSSSETVWWNGGEPIWITAEKKKRNSTGVYFWLGSEAELQGLRPSIYYKYTESVPFEQRVQTAISWFTDDNKDFVALYFHEPDSTGHTYGPGSTQVADKVREMDGILGLILDTLRSKSLEDKVNLIVLSDHGMTEIDLNNKLLVLWNYVNESLVERIPDYGAVTAILPKKGSEGEVLAQAQKIPHAKAYSKEAIPEQFHYRNHRRIMPIIIICEDGWSLTTDANKTRSRPRRGDHGYSNDLPSMKPIMFAAGPDFRQGLALDAPIYGVDVYPLLCRLLGLDPAPNNGSLQNTQALLRAAANQASVSAWMTLSVVAVVGRLMF